MRIAIICLLLIVAPIVAAGQNVGLLVAECGSVRGVCENYHLARFHFRDGVLVSKELVLTTNSGRVRYDLGKNRIYRDRYVITNWADIVDIQDKKLLHDGDGDFVATEGERIIQRLNRTDDGGYFYYDLTLNEYCPLLEPT